MQNAIGREPEKQQARATSAQPAISRRSLSHRPSWKLDHQPDETDVEVGSHSQLAAPEVPQSVKAAPESAPIPQLAASEVPQSVKAAPESTPIPDCASSGIKPENPEEENSDISASHGAPSLSTKQGYPRSELLLPTPKVSYANKIPGVLKDAAWPLVTCFITVVILVVLVAQASEKVDKLDKDTTQRAKSLMALLHVQELCVPECPESQCSVSKNIGFYCTNGGNGPNQSVIFAKEESFSWWVPVTASEWHARKMPRQQARSMALALHCCGAVDYFYTADDFRMKVEDNNINDTKFVENRTKSIMADDRNAACLTLLQKRLCNEYISDRESYYKNPDYDETKCKEIKDNITVPADGLIGAVDKFLFPKDDINNITYNFYTTNKTTNVNNLEKESNLQNYSEFHALDGVLNIDSSDNSEAIWLKIHQDNETANCIGTNDSTSDFWKRNTPCYKPRWHNGPSPIWLKPDVFKNYVCTTDGIEVESSAIYSQLRTAAEQNLTGNFIGIRIRSYNDLYAIYTAVLGACIGALAAAIASVIIVIAQFGFSYFSLAS